MASITLRSLKGSPLTIQEMDDNFSNINTELGSKLSISNYTASDILTKLKTVDGATSGLDADLVDGLNPDITAANNTIAARDGSGRIAATTFTGNLTGNVTGNVSGNVIGNLTGNVTGNTSGTATNVTGVVALANGGTGATTAAAARTNLGLGSLATLSTITSSEITNGTIAQIDMAADSVGTSQLINLNVTTAKINDLAVTEAKLANNSVTSGKIASGAVGANELNVVGNGTAGQYLQSDGDGSMTWSTLSNSYAGNKVAVYLTPGTYTWSVPDGVTSALVACYGAGGGGTPSGTAGVGGAGLVHVTNLTPGGSVSLTVGLGGESGTAGGASSFGSWITANGGGAASSGTVTNGTSTSGNGAIPYTIGVNTSQKLTFPWVDQTRGSRPSTSGNTARVNFSWTNGWLPGAGGQNSGTNYWTGVGGVGGLVLIYY